jgi:hypothetical protein
VSVDPINPAHYAGTLCAEIGERLTGNSYQILKYNWRLGKKDAPVIEIGKSIWYLNREIELAEAGWVPPVPLSLPTDEWFYQRYKDQTDFVQAICINLIGWNRHGDQCCLDALHYVLAHRKKEMEV